MSSSKSVAESLNNIHKEFESLKTVILDDPIKDDNQFTSINDKISLVDTDINQAKDLIFQTRQKAFDEDEKHHKKTLQFFEKVEEEILADAAAMKAFEVSYDHLDRLELKLCFLFLSIFPENAILKRRLLIYWWIGEGLITREEEGEKIFKELLKLGLTMPYGNSKSPHVNKCKVHPSIRYMLISLAKKANLFKFDSRGTPFFDSKSSKTPQHVYLIESLSQKNGWSNGNLSTIFNVNMRYVSFDTSLAKLEKLVVLQLGQWQDYRKHHIELMRDAILKEIGAYKYLKYLGLRGISKLISLPSSIFNLINLEILDLKACHSLRELSPNISSLKKLTHLDVSECYVLESMPKGIGKLTSLQVLKGLVIGSSTSTPCKIGVLKNLEKLKRLSIYISKEDMGEGEKFDELKELKSVQCLKISWVSNFPQNYSIESFFFPPNLENLELENLPQDSMPEWLNPQTLKSLKKLCIKGGKLSSLNCFGKIENKWNNVELLYLKYLRNLRIGLPDVKKLFPNLKYVQKFYEEGQEPETSQKIRSYGEFEWSKKASR